MPVLQQRLAAGTLLPDKCREEEVALFAVQADAAMRAMGIVSALSALELRETSTNGGYNALLVASSLTLERLHLGLWPDAERPRAEALVHAALDAVPATAANPFASQGEGMLHMVCDRCMTEGASSRLDPGFRAAVLAKWRSPAVADVLRSHGAMAISAEDVQQFSTEDKARYQADVSARGFRRCGLPACGKLETTVRHFKLCGGCDAVAYCCDEHHDVHWREGHCRECRHLKAAGAKPPSTADAT